MTLDEFFEMIDKWEYIPGDLIVRIGYKYAWEKFHHESNEILEYNGDKNEWMWLNDWDEGYDDVKFLGYVPVDDVPIETMWTPKKGG